MNASQPAAWRPTRLQTGIIITLLIASLGFVVFTAQDYLRIRGSFQVFNDQLDTLTTLSNLQRHTALLFASTNDWLNNPGTGKGEIEKQRIFLASQLRVVQPLLTPGSDVAHNIQEFRAALSEFDALLESLGENPSAASRQSARTQLAALLTKMDGLIKRAYDAQERLFVLSFSALLRQQETSRVALAGASVLSLLLVAGSSVIYLNGERRAFLLRQQQQQELQTALDNRTRALQLAAEVSRKISSLRSREDVVLQVVEQLKSAFNYYHAHIYLFDESGENLLMVGGTGEVGKTLLERGHSIPRGRGLVGRAAETGQVVLVPDTAAEPAWLPNPLLPETRAEIAVPILLGKQALGVLDVQNNQIGSLTELDALLISTVADQVAIALDNLRVNEEARQLLADYQALIDNSPAAIAILDAQDGAFVQANPQMLALFELSPEEMEQTGPIQLSPPTQPDGRPSDVVARERIQQALEQGVAVFDWMHHSKSGRVFRAEIRLTPAPSRAGRPMLNAIITDVTARYEAEQALQRRAAREAALNRISQSIQSAPTVEEALKITARELGHALGRKPTLVSIEPSALTTSHPQEQ